MNAQQIAAQLGLSAFLSPAMVLAGGKVGNKALVGQYIAQEPLLNKEGKQVGIAQVCKAEVINAQRNYSRKPHQSGKECARRVRQMEKAAAKNAIPLKLAA